MTSEALQKVLKTFSDPTRVRILALLEREELAVQELMDVLGMAQSRVSRHLAILREAGLLRDRRDGTYVFYRFLTPPEGPWREAWDLVKRSLRDDPTHERDAVTLGRVLETRAEHSRSFFDSVGPEWDAVRKVFNDDTLRAGTGTGILAAELARLGLRVVAIDNSPRMLQAARAKLQQEQLANIELRQGQANDLPLADAEVDAALAHMVLQYLPSPAEAIREMARAVRPGGTVVAVDFVSHQHEWMRHELGVTWLGFAPEEIETWFSTAQLVDFRCEEHEGLSSGRDLPATFIAWARVPASPN
jgi:DNA-binding transcriptional ArsR family regulator